MAKIAKCFGAVMLVAIPLALATGRAAAQGDRDAGTSQGQTEGTRSGGMMGGGGMQGMMMEQGWG